MSAYAERQHLPYAARQLFDLVANVEQYPQFMPWVVEARILRREERTIAVEMMVEIGPLLRRFTTIATLDRPRRIDISSGDPMFDRFEQRWTFEPVAGGGANVEYRVDFRFRSGILQRLMSAAFADEAKRTALAFRRRAHRLYGSPP